MSFLLPANTGYAHSIINSPLESNYVAGFSMVTSVNTMKNTMKNTMIRNC